MPIPFRDLDSSRELGPAAFLRLAHDPEGADWFGALFLVNARGEPLEFTFNRADLPSSPLWREADARRQLVRSLILSLLSACPRIPRLLLCLASEVSGDLFTREIQLSLPVCRLASARETSAYLVEERKESLEAADPVQLFWFPDRPPDGSPEQLLLQELTAGGLLFEPFDRALAGLREVYGQFDRRTHAP
ncbi:MAG TPA: hypothetical protein VFD42_06155 [Chloroflexota bacterium]|nr:hypothetical protein [Chloroflexota bacterium]